MQCWSTAPEDRPLAEEVGKALQRASDEAKAAREAGAGDPNNHPTQSVAHPATTMPIQSATPLGHHSNSLFAVKSNVLAIAAPVKLAQTEPSVKEQTSYAGYGHH